MTRSMTDPLVFSGIIAVLWSGVALGQSRSSSLYVNDQAAIEAERKLAEAAGVDFATGTNVSGTIQSSSLIAVKPVPERKFRKHDFIKIIVNEQKRYSSEGELEQEKEWDKYRRVDCLIEIQVEHRSDLIRSRWKD